jgi:REP element-mobilizing transposase RayT
MARQLRLDFPGALHHITSRGNERRAIFRSDRDRKLFLGLLGQAALRFGWSVTAWVLMTNHFHLLVQTPEANLSRGMQWLSSTYAMAFNERHGRSGHLFQGRFHSFLVHRESYLAEVLRYIVLNPVRAKMVEHPADYRWSSYRATAGLSDAPKWLDVRSALAVFACDPATAEMEYREFVCAGIASEQRLWTRVVNGIYLGSGEWAKEMRRRVESRIRSTDHPKAQRAVGRPAMHTIIDAVAHAANATSTAIRTTRGGPLRRLAAWIGWHEGLLTLRTIAASLRLRSEGHISTMIRRCTADFGRDPALLRQYDVAIAALRR